MLKKILFAVAASCCFAVQACWFTVENFNACYLAGVNNYTAHCQSAATLSSAVYVNGSSVALPITVYVKVSPRTADQPGESSGTKVITKAVLQYKVLPNGNWVTVRTIQNVSFPLNWNTPVPLFGKNNIDPAGLSSGTAILIRCYFTDGTYETGDLDTDITSTIPNQATSSSGGTYEGGWTAPFVFKVIWNGTRRAK